MKRRTVRFRLAFRYATLFFVSSSVIVVISFWLVSRSLSTLPTSPSYNINNTLSDLLLFSLLGLGAMAVISGGLGWLMAGRVLRPVREITNTARRASEESLAERVGLEGPPDEMKELADTFDAMLDRLEAAFESQRFFIANASHELRTPLTAMLTAIEVTFAKADRTPAQLEAMAELVRLEVEHASSLIDALLTLARSEHGAATNEFVDLATAGEDSLDAAKSRIEDRDLKVTCALEPAELHGDRLLIERMVGNLIDNATRHCDRGGWIRVSSGRRDNRVFMEVVNSGEAIPNDMVTALLEPFRRLNSRVGDTEGAGLGLAIVNAVATSHHGTVALNGRVGGGLEILVQLPIQNMSGHRVRGCPNRADPDGVNSSKQATRSRHFRRWPRRERRERPPLIRAAEDEARRGSLFAAARDPKES